MEYFELVREKAWKNQQINLISEKVYRPNPEDLEKLSVFLKTQGT